MRGKLNIRNNLRMFLESVKREMEDADKLEECGYTVSGEPIGMPVGQMFLVMSKNSGAEYVALVSGDEKPDPRADVGTLLTRSIDFSFRLNHPNVVHAIKLLAPRSCGALGNRLVLFLPTFKTSLAAVRDSLPVREKIKVCFQVASALLYLGRMGIQYPALNMNLIVLDNKMNARLMPDEDRMISTRKIDIRGPIFDIDRDPVFPHGVWSGSSPLRLAVFMFKLLFSVNTVTVPSFAERSNLFRYMERDLRMKMSGNEYKELKLDELLILILNMMDYTKEETENIFLAEPDSIKFKVRPSLADAVAKLSIMYNIPIEEGNELTPKPKVIFIDESVIEILITCLLGLEKAGRMTFESVMLTADLFYRSVPYYEKPKGDMDYDSRNFGLLFVVCYRLAMKFLDERIPHIDRLYNVPAIPVTEESATKLNAVEASIIEIHRGCLHRRFLFHQCTSTGQCVDAYKELVNPKYLNIDPFEWVRNHPPRGYSIDLNTTPMYWRVMELYNAERNTESKVSPKSEP